MARTTERALAKETAAGLLVRTSTQDTVWMLTTHRSRNMINILLFVAEQSKRYYPAGEIPEMMAAFLPLLTKDVSLYARTLTDY